MIWEIKSIYEEGRFNHTISCGTKTAVLIRGDNGELCDYRGNINPTEIPKPVERRIDTYQEILKTRGCLDGINGKQALESTMMIEDNSRTTQNSRRRLWL